MRDYAKEGSGLPLGAKFKGRLNPIKGQYCITEDGELLQAKFDGHMPRFIVEFTHGYGQCPLEDVPIPAGEKLLGGSVARAWGVRDATFRNRWIGHDGSVCHCSGQCFTDQKYLRLEPKPNMKRFLVTADREIVDEYWADRGTIDSRDADALVREFPSHYKIVERPE